MEALILGTVIIFVWLTLLFAVQLKTQDAAIADFGWATGLGFLVVFYALTAVPPSGRAMLLALLGATWALRLAYFILFNRVLTAGEDSRYRALREHWGPRANMHFFFLFQGQTVVAVLFAIPIIIAMSHPETAWRIWDTFGLLIWVVAVTGEWMADRQLAAFRADEHNRGKTCRKGLWAYSRHPNYFFEWLHWWSYVFFAVGHTYGWITLLGPVVMFLFLFKITGIPYTEKQALLSRGEDYKAYQRTTNVFFPWFPRKEQS